MMDYCNEVEDFFNYALSNLRNISRGCIKCSCNRCKNKKNRFRCCNDSCFTKRVHREILVLLCTQRTIGFLTYRGRDRMIKSTSSASNKYGVVDDNSNPYKDMIMNVMKMNQDYVGQYSIIYEELNEDTTKFFDFLKDSS